VSRILIAKGRFEAFSDGVFAIAITLLVLDLPIPRLAAADEPTLGHALLALWPQLLVYCASFLTIGIMWFNHYALFHYAKHITYASLVGNIVLLLLVAFLPYPTWLLAQYAHVPVAVCFYGATLFAISIAFGYLGYVATLPDAQTPTFWGFLCTRTAWNTLGPIVYALGTVLAFYNTIASIACFVLIAIFYLLPGTVRGSLVASARAHGQELG
jgi:uncharacterized membrane protein